MLTIGDFARPDTADHQGTSDLRRDGSAPTGRRRWIQWLPNATRWSRSRRTEFAHDEAFTTITKAQWDYSAILAAYDAVACSPEATARPGCRLSCREVYLAEPATIGDNDLICDIAFPLG